MQRAPDFSAPTVSRPRAGGPTHPTPTGGEPPDNVTGVDRGSRAQDWRCWDVSLSWARASQSEHVTPGPPPDPPTTVARRGWALRPGGRSVVVPTRSSPKDYVQGDPHAERLPTTTERRNRRREPATTERRNGEAPGSVGWSRGLQGLIPQGFSSR
ncbi:hypothetical protein GCM10023237_46680 [Streptomyces coeruleoprunus]